MEERDPGLQPTRILPRLTLIVLAVDLVKSAVGALWQRYVFLPNIPMPFAAGVPLDALNFFSSLILFAISPGVLFVLLYRVGGGVRLEAEGTSAAVSLFLGGAVAGALGVLVTETVFSQGSSAYLAAMETQFTNGWYLGSLLVSALENGLFDVFLGMTAILFASYRPWGAPSEAERGGVPGEEGQSLEGIGSEDGD
jgi:hypothetical protein